MAADFLLYVDHGRVNFVIFNEVLINVFLLSLRSDFECK